MQTFKLLLYTMKDRGMALTTEIRCMQDAHTFFKPCML